MKLSIFSSILRPTEIGAVKLINNIKSLTDFANVEYVIVSTKTSEDSKDIIIHETRDYDNIRVSFEAEDAGLYGSWNKAISLCRGDYVANANYDDRKLDDFITLFLEEIERGGDILYADSIVARTEAKLDNPNLCVYRSLLPEYSVGGLIKYCLPFCSPVWRRDLHSKANLKFSDAFMSAGDLEFWCRAQFLFPQLHFRKINKLASVYYLNPNGASTSKTNAERRAAFETAIKREYAKKLLYSGPLSGKTDEIYVPLQAKTA